MTLVKSSGLRLRYRVSQALQIADGVAMMVGFVMLHRDHEVAFAVPIPTGVLLVATEFVYEILALRRPPYGLQLAWYAYTKLQADQNTGWLDQANKCPRCGPGALGPSQPAPRYDPHH